MPGLNNKIALITGGTSGIGLGTASEFLKAGAEVVIITGRCNDRGKEALSVLDDSRAVYVMCDVTSKDDIMNLYQYIDREFGRLDILFNNAGLLITDALEDIKDEDWDRMFDANVKSCMHMCKTFIPMLKRSNGVILNNASVNGLHYYIKGTKSYMYATTKAALIQFTKYLAKNYAPEIRANVLCPGITETNLFTNKDFSRFKDVNLLGRMANPSEIGKAALFLCRDDASFITGIELIVDGVEIIK